MEGEGFSFGDGFLRCEDVRVKDIQNGLSTIGIFPSSPCFVYSKKKIVSNISAYQTALKMLNIPSLLNFSMKANHIPAILEIVRSMECSVSLVSGMELKMALKLGFDPRLIVFNGNGKHDWERVMAITEGCLINVDSTFDLMHTMRICQKLTKTAKVLLRINPDIDPQVHPFISTGLATSKFGVSTEDLEECVSLLEKCSQITLVGLHCHVGSTIQNVSVFRSCTMKLMDLKSELKTRGFNYIKYINIGGGLDINYKQMAWRTSPARSSCTVALDDGSAQTADQATLRQFKVTERVSQNDLNYNSSCSELTCGDLKVPTPGDMVESIQSALKDHDITLILEPGRSLVGNTAVLATTVLGTKGNHSKR
ncbi:diaminopimelate decarboxylase 1, chloroplastic-like [Haliotis rubra]|uniref:diaminopimelate decarboxylase 1, chloroplastic-like n=1 Tax=Haliotis rubra TaxID=36100 RepID=UPI001EE60DAD|nr:diaminopimelate decarboxylase 1, chloroplastic-like [Haliotis rubra]